jgi:hypothetical protein
MVEQEKPKDKSNDYCFYCGKEQKAMKKVLLKDVGEQFVCERHILVLAGIKITDDVSSWEAEWGVSDHKDEFENSKDIDEWEDIDSWLY